MAGSKPPDRRYLSHRVENLLTQCRLAARDYSRKLKMFGSSKRKPQSQQLTVQTNPSSSITMALTPSTMLPLGTQAPDFNLPDPDGQIFHLPAIGEAAGTLIAFWCNHCPYVKLLKEHFSAYTRELQNADIRVFAINSNDPDSYPEDGSAPMRAEIRAFNYAFPYLIDLSQDTARAYQAACTPDFFLFDTHLRLVYRGQYDGARPGQDTPVTGSSLKAAVQALLEGQPPIENQQPSLGCNIKWRPGK